MLKKVEKVNKIV